MEFRSVNLNDVWYLIKAARYTIILTAIGFAGGMVLGIIISIFRTTKKLKIFNYLAGLYVEFFRGTPILIQMFMFFYGIAILFKFRVPPLIAASTSLIFWTASNIGESLAGIINSIPKSQWEASSSLGLSYIQQLRYVILPQTFRTALPPIVGILIMLIKATSLASIVGFLELTRAGVQIMGSTMNPVTVFPIVAAIYFIICYPLSLYSNRLELKLQKK